MCCEGRQLAGIQAHASEGRRCQKLIEMPDGAARSTRWCIPACPEACTDSTGLVCTGQGGAQVNLALDAVALSLALLFGLVLGQPERQ